jgi:hypothetical protein
MLTEIIGGSRIAERIHRHLLQLVRTPLRWWLQQLSRLSEFRPNHRKVAFIANALKRFFWQGWKNPKIALRGMEGQF